jgi:hypothetical protein
MTMPRFEAIGICPSTKKRKYADRKNAIAAIEWTAKSVGEDPLTWDAYVCKQCQDWHVGHIPARRRVFYISDEALVDSIVHE